MAVETLDGDTPHADRSAVRDHADVILSNPDMLHVTVLPQVRKQTGRVLLPPPVEQAEAGRKPPLDHQSPH